MSHTDFNKYLSYCLGEECLYMMVKYIALYGRKGDIYRVKAFNLPPNPQDIINGLIKMIDNSIYEINTNKYDSRNEIIKKVKTSEIFNQLLSLIGDIQLTRVTPSNISNRISKSKEDKEKRKEKRLNKKAEAKAKAQLESTDDTQGDKPVDLTVTSSPGAISAAQQFLNKLKGPGQDQGSGQAPDPDPDQGSGQGSGPGQAPDQGSGPGQGSGQGPDPDQGSGQGVV